MPKFVNLPLRTARMTLRPVTVEDAGALFDIFSDPEVMRYWATRPWTRIEQAVENIANAQTDLLDGAAIRLGLVPHEIGRVIGTCTLWQFDAQNRRAEIGYIQNRAMWGQGYMHEALTALIDYAFTALNLNRLEADADPRNASSLRRLERLGFHHEGTFRERWIVEGEVCDSAMYGLLASDWSARKAQPQ